MVGVRWSGGEITRMSLADANERAKGTRRTFSLLFKEDVELAGIEGGKGFWELRNGGVPGLEKTIARRSSFSLP